MNYANWNWKAIKAIGMGTLVILLLVILSIGLAHSVAQQFWIAAQLCLLGILVLLTIATWQIRYLLLDRSAQETWENSGDLGIASIVGLLLFTFGGVAAVIIYAIQYDHWKSAAVARIAGVSLLTAGASLAAGGVLGFIFGVPKARSAPSTTTAGTSPAVSADSMSSDGQFGANTNLEQISDWLTKTIVGVSLVELSKLPALLDKLAAYVGAGMGDAGPPGKAVALVVMIYFVSAGFLISYLWARTELTRAFSESTLSKRVRDLERQSAIDAQAISIVDKWLNHHPVQQEEDKARGEMISAIKSSSSVTRSQVFVTADDYKRSAGAAKDEIQRRSQCTLPIFQALVDADSEGIFHRNRGQYAFSLMTQPTPDWQRALNILQDAIAIRDRSNDFGWPEYEFARAICRIKLDPLAKTKPDARNAIDADLNKAHDLKLEVNKRAGLDLDQEAAKWNPNVVW